MKIDYQLEYRKQLQRNISLVRNEIDNPDFVLKITNHAEKFGREYDEVKSKIMTDDMYAEWFAKDPAKQNIYEKLAASYISGIEDVVDFRNLPNSALLCEVAVLKHHSFNIALPLNRITMVHLSTSPAILQSKC